MNTTGQHTSTQHKKRIFGVDITSPEVPLSPADIARITQRRKKAQVALRKRIDEDVVIDG
jgi:hypothetical protein